MSRVTFVVCHMSI